MNLSKRVVELTPPHLRYARQLGVRHIIGYLPQDLAAPTWEFIDLLTLRKEVEAYDLEFAAVGSPPLSLMRPIIEATPQRDEALELLCASIRNLGSAGIPRLCYSFSVTSTWGHWRTGLNGGARGGAGVMSFDYNLVRDAPVSPAGEVDADEMWARLRYFLDAVVPVAEEAGVQLACHPDDPPVPTLRGTARILSRVEGLQRLLDERPSAHSGLTFCQGTMAESGADIEAAIRSFVGQERVFVVHFRNIHRHPDEHLHYDETFIDEGDMDMIATLQLYQQLGYSGLMDPDHAPVMEGDGHFVRERGYAYALGYMRAVQQQWQRDAAAEEPA